MKKINILIIIVVMIAGVLSTYSYFGVSASIERQNQKYSSFCEQISEKIDIQTDMKFVIYLDVEACLTCTDHIPSWIDFEKQLLEINGQFIIFTNQRDSLDVAIAMELEGLKSDIHILNNETINELQLNTKKTPVKILFDNKCEPVLIKEAFSSENEAEKLYQKLLTQMRS